jgi:5-methylcytosine-specific restriction protein B
MYAHQKNVEWKIEDPDFENKDNGLRTTVKEITSARLVSKLNEILGIDRLFKQPDTTKIAMKDFPLNQILFGPPGSGKTYTTINKALEIVGENLEETQDRIEVKRRFNERVKKGQIVFTTFHQSLSYEDFIEGIKPTLERDGPIDYTIQAGIFKRACALAGFYAYSDFLKTKKQSAKYSFDDLFESFIGFIQEKLSRQESVLYKSIRGRDIEVISINKNQSIIARAKGSAALKPPAPLTRENIRKLYDKFNNIDEISDIGQVRDTVQILPRITEFYAVFRGLKDYERNYSPEDQEIEESEALDLSKIQIEFEQGVYSESIKSHGKGAKPLVFIIDEINRGNVSQIFGELITLIEEDKRLGRKEALEATLPYSKEKFGVPQNLYIIGTMNTADRSVEALDTALRRRFSFTEMSPDVSQLTKYVIGDLQMANILTAINSRIEKLLDRDHQIGHSYLMVNDLVSLKAVFRNKIIPLLQEYFFGDYGKIGLILGKGFVEIAHNKTTFADFDYDDLSSYDDRLVYKVTDISTMNEISFIEAVRKLLNKQLA